MPAENLITVAAQCLWNTAGMQFTCITGTKVQILMHSHAVSFMSTAAARSTILEPVQQVVDALAKVSSQRSRLTYATYV